MDIVRLFNHWQEGKPRDELQVNFDEVAGGALPCVWIPDEMGEYDYALTVVPGETLRFIYEKIWQPDSGSERSLVSESDGESQQGDS